MGDSITYGYGLRDRQADAYPVRLGRWLGTNYDVRNFGANATALLHRGDYPYIGRPDFSYVSWTVGRPVSLSTTAIPLRKKPQSSWTATRTLDVWSHFVMVWHTMPYQAKWD